MEKKEFKQEAKKEEPKEEPKEESKSIELGQTPDTYRAVISTPDGVMEIPDYLVWLGNKVMEMKKVVSG